MKTIDHSKSFEKIKIKTDTNTVISKEQEVKSIHKSEKDVLLKNYENSGDIEIKGKTDPLNGFVYHNIQNGDTLQSITIQGNADFKFKNKWNQEDKKEQSSEKKEQINKIAEIARKAVSQKTIVSAAKEAKNINKKIKSTGFPFNIYICAALVVIVLILIWYFRKSIGVYIPNFIKKIFKNGQSNKRKN